MEHADKLLVDVKEAARLVSVSESTMWGLVRTGEIRSVKIGQLRRIPVQALAEWVKKLAA